MARTGQQGMRGQAVRASQTHLSVDTARHTTPNYVTGRAVSSTVECHTLWELARPAECPPTLQNAPDAAEWGALRWDLDVQLEDSADDEGGNRHTKRNGGDAKADAIAFCLLHTHHHCGGNLRGSETRTRPRSAYGTHVGSQS